MVRTIAEIMVRTVAAAQIHYCTILLTCPPAEKVHSRLDVAFRYLGGGHKPFKQIGCPFHRRGCYDKYAMREIVIMIYGSIIECADFAKKILRLT